MSRTTRHDKILRRINMKSILKINLQLNVELFSILIDECCFSCTGPLDDKSQTETRDLMRMTSQQTWLEFFWVINRTISINRIFCSVMTVLSCFNKILFSRMTKQSCLLATGFASYSSSLTLGYQVQWMLFSTCPISAAEQFCCRINYTYTIHKVVMKFNCMKNWAEIVCFKFIYHSYRDIINFKLVKFQWKCEKINSFFFTYLNMGAKGPTRRSIFMVSHRWLVFTSFSHVLFKLDEFPRLMRI